MKKIWYFVSILFGFYSLSILNDERYEVTYVKGEKREEINYLACVDLKSIFPNKTKLNLDQLKEEFYNYFVRVNSKWMKDYYPALFNNLILNPIKSRSYIIWFHQICWIANDSDKLSQICNSLDSSTKIFAFERETFQFLHLNRDNLVNKLVVQNEEKPYSNCTDKDYSKFRCLNDCFKENVTRSSKYYYDGIETGSIDLDYDLNKKASSKQEINCFNQCNEEACKLTYFSLTALSISSYSPVKFFKANPVMSDLEYWVQLFGLICLFISTSFYQLLSTSIELLITRTKKDKIKRSLFYLKISILAILLVFVIGLYTLMVKDHKNKQIIQTKKETIVNLMQPETINLAVCLYMNQNYYKIYESKTFLDIEKDTNTKFNETVEKIYLKYQNKKMKINWIIKSKVLFKLDIGFINSFSRCFQIEIYPNEPKYQMLLSTSKLVIKFKDYGSHSLFLLTKNEHLNSKSYSWAESRTFIKKETKRQINCIDYEKAYSNCTSKWNCIDSCINRKLFNEYQNITFIYTNDYNSVIDKNQFTKQEWSNSFLNFKSNQDFYYQIKKECIQKYSDESCDEIKFEDSIKISQKISNAKRIDLYYDVIRTVEEKQSWYKLLLDMLNIQSIFCGLTIFKIIQIIFKFIQTKLKIRNDKIFILITHLICLFGFIIHIYHILNLIINEELTSSQHYEESDQIQMPDIIFCFKIDRKLIDKNNKLTGTYLNQATSHLKMKNIFKNIVYLDESNEWIELKSNLTDNKFKIATFFYSNQKCFILEQRTKYHKNQFHFSINKQVLKVNFNQTFIQKDGNSPYFMTKKRGQLQFSKINQLIYKSISLRHYSINQELFSIIYEDKFNFIKNPLSSFHYKNDLNDADKYLKKLMQNFEQTYKLVTLNFPVKKKNSKNEIDDDLFEEYFSQIQNLTDFNTPANLNYEKQSVINYLQNNFKDSFDFKFGLTFFKKIIKITNKDNYAKLILNLLNSLSIWFDLSVLDLYGYVNFLNFYVFITYLNPKIEYLSNLFNRQLLRFEIFFAQMSSKR